MEVLKSGIFQTDSELVIDEYNNNLNYTIEYNHKVRKEYCILYFSSNNIYYPNNEAEFIKSIIENNKFELYKNRIAKGHKHIFFRDIKKQWYLTGINNDINDPIKLLEFIRNETLGYKNIFVGSSAGGFISVILGQQLNAERIYSFNGQFEIMTLAKKINAPYKNPILSESLTNFKLLPFYDTKNFITNPETIYYFHSSKSSWDIEQYKHISNLKINLISFKTSNHGIPFLKNNLNVIINLTPNKLKNLVGRDFHPLLFSLRVVGLKKTMQALIAVLKVLLRKFKFFSV
ncbi:hypothetical protein [Spirosoma fluviale]|uniref:Uncharacterized protein n=1 Tax=Spirosoma fluviale TaxID=1597977 RepID=A0A286GRV7_9BACT|nr:hypothetical protein [Spirosoma fluviale]SOD98305.1 hypothetical protein SAMN06269250_6018 [Spirosoma fluviale]